MVRTSSQLVSPATTLVTESSNGRDVWHFGRECAKPSTFQEGIALGNGNPSDGSVPAGRNHTCAAVMGENTITGACFGARNLFSGIC